MKLKLWTKWWEWVVAGVLWAIVGHLVAVYCTLTAITVPTLVIGKIIGLAIVLLGAVSIVIGVAFFMSSVNKLVEKINNQ